jgi:hypothetical protein
MAVGGILMHLSFLARTAAVAVGLLAVTSCFAQVVQWRKFYNAGTGTENRGRFVVRDPSGHFIVGGSTELNQGASDFLIQKYTSDGVRVWSVRYDSGADDWAMSMSVDAGGNVYMCGFFGSQAPRGLLVKVSSLGQVEWSFKHARMLESVFASTLNGPVTVCGIVDTQTQAQNMITLQLSSAGILQWKNQYNGGGTNNDMAMSVCRDADDNDVFVVGTTRDNEGNTTMRLLKYSENGALLWRRNYTGVFANATGDRVVPRPNGGCVVMGTTGELNAKDVFVAAYDEDGDTIWRRVHNGGGNDTPTGFATNSSGQIAVTDYCFTSETGYFAVVLLYNGDGTRRFAKRFVIEGPDVVPTAVALNDQGTVFVAGTLFTGSVASAFTLKYDSSGNRLQYYRFNAPNGGNAHADGVAFDPDGRLVATGNASGISSAKEDLMIFKLVQ